MCLGPIGSPTRRSHVAEEVTSVYALTATTEGLFPPGPGAVPNPTTRQPQYPVFYTSHLFSIP